MAPNPRPSNSQASDDPQVGQAPTQGLRYFSSGGPTLFFLEGPVVLWSYALTATRPEVGRWKYTVMSQRGGRFDDA